MEEGINIIVDSLVCETRYLPDYIVASSLVYWDDGV